jgi:hypothetical protein
MYCHVWSQHVPGDDAQAERSLCGRSVECGAGEGRGTPTPPPLGLRVIWRHHTPAL